jgi:hypothetical protein
MINDNCDFKSHYCLYVLQIMVTIKLKAVAFFFVFCSFGEVKKFVIEDDRLLEYCTV